MSLYKFTSVGFLHWIRTKKQIGSHTHPIRENLSSFNILQQRCCATEHPVVAVPLFVFPVTSSKRLNFHIESVSMGALENWAGELGEVGHPCRRWAGTGESVD